VQDALLIQRIQDFKSGRAIHRIVAHLGMKSLKLLQKNYWVLISTNAILLLLEIIQDYLKIRDDFKQIRRRKK